MRRARHITRALLVAILIPAMLLCQVPPARADLTEIIVGATLAYQALQVAATIIPQIATLTANVLTLFKTGQDLAGAAKDLFGNLAPKPKGNAAHPHGKPAGPPLSLKDVPVITGPTGAPALSADQPKDPMAAPSPAAADASATEIPSDLSSRVDSLVRAYTEQLALKDVIGQPGNLGPLSMQYSNSVSRAQQLTTVLSTQVLDAITDGDKATVDALVAKVRAMPSSDRGALTPVLHTVLDGARFDRLHGASSQGASIQALRALQTEIGR